VMNRIRDECRRVAARPHVDLIDDRMPDNGLSPLEAAIGKEGVAKYETALQSLRDEDRQAIVGRVEMGYSYQELAVMFGKPSPDAARISVSRALMKLAEVLRQSRSK
jgi:DNA-directed RNA polymerase specialized sigma24 family protein